jgi:hypothetical protein
LVILLCWPNCSLQTFILFWLFFSAVHPTLLAILFCWPYCSLFAILLSAGHLARLAVLVSAAILLCWPSFSASHPVCWPSCFADHPPTGHRFFWPILLSLTMF